VRSGRWVPPWAGGLEDDPSPAAALDGRRGARAASRPATLAHIEPKMHGMCGCIGAPARRPRSKTAQEKLRETLRGCSRAGALLLQPVRPSARPRAEAMLNSFRLTLIERPRAPMGVCMRQAPSGVGQPAGLAGLQFRPPSQGRAPRLPLASTHQRRPAQPRCRRQILATSAGERPCTRLPSRADGFGLAPLRRERNG